MAKIACYNNSLNAIFVGGVMIPPGDTREVEETLHPGYRSEDKVQASDEPRHIVDVLLAGDESALLAAIPTLAVEDLEELGGREQQGLGREAVLAAIASRLLENASAAEGAGASTVPANKARKGSGPGKD